MSALQFLTSTTASMSEWPSLPLHLLLPYLPVIALSPPSPTAVTVRGILPCGGKFTTVQLSEVQCRAD